MKDLVDKLIQLIEKYLPSVLLAFGIGYKQGSKDKSELEKQMLELQVALEKEKNRRAIEAANKGIDDRSAIRAAIDKGRDILRRKQ